LLFQTSSPIIEIRDQFLVEKSVRLFVKRDDLLDSNLQGNKARKLKYNIEHILNNNISEVVSFGGAFSNHIHALAAAGERFGFGTVGYIRGEISDPYNPTLSFARKCGMKLVSLKRTEYRERSDPEFLVRMQNLHPDSFIIPEGGSNQLALKGCAEIVDEVEDQLGAVPDNWFVAGGTGATAAGIIQGLRGRSYLNVVSVLKGDFLSKDIRKYLVRSGGKETLNWSVLQDYHFGGYARYTSDLVHFINRIKTIYQLPLDPIYTGKMFYACLEMIRGAQIPADSKILCMHTGGLQGIEGFNYMNGDLLD
jgi:1-aminocyclopropane-1-carboxylate deaminase/D-cysteine desulfhydrase-like pyridoxal-dependent ACC family enzyme